MSAANDNVDGRDGTVRELSAREVRALTESLIVVADRGAVRDAPGLVHVYAADGTRCLVDARDGGCQCPDATYRDDVTCKHIHAARFCTGRRPIPPFVDAAAVDRNTRRAARTAPESER